MNQEVIEIDSRRPWWHFDGREFWARRDLLLLLIKKDLFAAYKQSLLGPAWFIIQPLLTSLVFSLIFGRFARLAPKDVSPFLYFLAGHVLWTYFQSNVSAVSSSLAANSSILGKIYFPRLIIPITASGVNAVHFAFNYLVFVTLYIGFQLFTNWSSPLTLRGVPVVLLLVLFVGMVGTGIGTWLAAWTVKYRDLRIGMPVILQLWMFATPVIWPWRLVPEGWRWLFALNPMVFVVELHRAVVLGTQMPSLTLILSGAAIGMMTVVGGFLMFNWAQGNMVDTL